MNPVLAQAVNRRLPPEEAHAYLSQPITPMEREGVLQLVQWFTARYRTPLERLAYVRRATTRWVRTARAVEPR